MVSSLGTRHNIKASVIFVDKPQMKTYLYHQKSFCFYDFLSFLSNLYVDAVAKAEVEKVKQEFIAKGVYKNTFIFCGSYDFRRACKHVRLVDVLQIVMMKTIDCFRGVYRSVAL